MKYTDTDRINFLQEIMVDEGEYTKTVILRPSTSGRGYRLHETSCDGSCDSVRDAIDKVMEDKRHVGA